MNSRNTRRSTSSAAYSAGPSLYDWLDGQTIAPCGPEVVPASHSAQPANEKERLTNDISGLRCSGSSTSADLQSFLENKSVEAKQSGDLLERLRKCKKCSTEKPYSEYYVNSKGGRRWSCKACEKMEERARKRDNPAGVSASHKRWRGERRGHALVNVARHRAKIRGMECSLDPENIQARIDLGTCEETGIAFDLTTPRAWNAPSLDRRDSTKGYTMANTRVVLYALNVAANTWGENRVLQIASAILAKRKERSNSLSISLGERLRERLSGLGSQEYEMTWNRSVTPCGHVYFRLAASGRRTSGSDCSGWPTPCQQDGAKGGPSQGADRLPGAVSGWATPAARDWRSKSAGPEFNAARDSHPRGKPLSYEALGAITSGESAATASGVVRRLNPAMSRFLMGYPPEWDQASPGWEAWTSLQDVLRAAIASGGCGPTETR
jgi:hypothetical protein